MHLRLNTKEVVKLRKKKLKVSKFNISKLLLVCVIGYCLYVFSSQQIEINKYNSQIKMYEGEIYSKTGLLNHYEDEIKKVGNPEYIENVARDNLRIS